MTVSTLCQKWDLGCLEDTILEQSIGELKHAILESRIRLERLTSEMTWRSRALHLHDGASVLRTVYALLAGRTNHQLSHRHSKSMAARGFLTQSPRYSGLTLLEPYLAQVDLAAFHDGWSREETATHFTLALEGPALQVLIDLSSEERCNLQALAAALNRCFGQRTSAEQRREELTD